MIYKKGDNKNREIDRDNYCGNDGIDAHIENLMQWDIEEQEGKQLKALSFQHVLGKILGFFHNPFENSLSFQHFHNNNIYSFSRGENNLFKGYISEPLR